ncbi:MAG: leucine-rich repeat domain-containing protein, partial [Victivallales bacterium]|nr:leucine-rich repeat domain-containing protein [Victivallales bacterium]
MKCQHCQKECTDELNYCPYCGTQINKLKTTTSTSSFLNIKLTENDVQDKHLIHKYDFINKVKGGGVWLASLYGNIIQRISSCFTSKERINEAKQNLNQKQFFKSIKSYQRLFLFSSIIFIIVILFNRCGRYEPEKNFKINPVGNEVEIVKYLGTSIEVKIPSRIDGWKVTVIGGFGRNTEITKIIIPKSVKKIKKDAFHGCTKLTSIAIPRSVTSIGPSAFQGCTGLTSIAIPKSVTSIGP